LHAFSAPVAKPQLSPEELEAERARLSQNVNRLESHQIMEVLTMIQQASPVPTVRTAPSLAATSGLAFSWGTALAHVEASTRQGEEGDSNGEIEIDLNELPPDALVRIQAYVDSCLASNLAGTPLCLNPPLGG
jgi:hypothetical protein